MPNGPGRPSHDNIFHNRVRNLADAAKFDAVPPGVDLRRLRLGRLQRVRAEMQRQDVAVLILIDPINIRYATDARNMTNFTMRTPARYLFLPVEGPVILFEFSGAEHLGQGLETIDEVRTGITVAFATNGRFVYEKAKEWAAQLHDLIRRHSSGSSRIGLERVHFAAARALAGYGYEIVDAHAILDLARMVKLPDEIACMRASIRTVELGMHRMRAALKPGITENELWAILYYTVIESNGEYLDTRLLSSGGRTNPWYNEATSRPVQKGELVAFDTDVIGPFGYYADISRTFYCGDSRPNDEQHRLYRLAWEQINHNLELLRPGMTFRDVAEKAWPLPEAYVANRYFCLAHGANMVGGYPNIMHKEDFDTFGYDGVIEANMVLCVESYIGEEGGNEGVKLEHQLLVTEQGPVLMSQFPFEEALLGREL
jgi:Xaa-Pro aminopeptidase